MQGRDKAIAMILAKVKPEGGGKGKMGSEYEDEHGDELEAVAHELVEAMQAGDAKGVAEALRGAFACMEAAPHVEGKHIGEEGEGEEEEEEEEEGESSGASSDLFSKYFGGGNVRKYADGGSVSKGNKPSASHGMSRKDAINKMMHGAKKKLSDRGSLR